MYRSPRPWLPPLLVIVVSLLLRFLLILYYWPEVFDTSYSWYSDDYKYHFFKDIYIKVYTKVGPYSFGMWAAYLHFYNKNYDFAKGWRKVIIEWLCFIGYTFITIIN